MAIIQCSQLPAFQYIAFEGIELKSPIKGHKKTTIALLNMMPDKALEATERQFIRLLGKAQSHKNIYFYPFGLDNIKRSKKAEMHISNHYRDFQSLRENGIDALIISGTNVPVGEMSKAPFWQDLTKVFDWVKENNIPTLFTCLASHCAIEYFYQQKRIPLAQKCWGVFEHSVKHPHPLTKNLPNFISVPHSRMNTISKLQMQQSHLEILIHSDQVGVHMALSKQHPNFIFFQGHLEYDAISLFKEYKREISLFLEDKRKHYPPFPENYLSSIQQQSLNAYKEKVLLCQNKTERQQLLNQFPNKEIEPHIPHSWHQAAIKVMENLLTLIN